MQEPEHEKKDQQEAGPSPDLISKPRGTAGMNTRMST